ncbi:MAG: polysaccharide biosynthesis C-terminal domain-containing protein [Chromatiaceae bacterium]|nr:polysaccharide biosynthesis C-terminal domain-containing protein [Chromatiaceae bacterium]
MLMFFIKFIELRIPIALNDRFHRISQEHKQIASGFAVVAVFILLGKMVAAAKEIAIAWRYGISETVDAYLFTFNLAQWPVNILGGVMAAVMIPVVARIQRKDPGEVSTFRAELLGSTLWLGMALGTICWLFLPWLVTQPWIGLRDTQIGLAHHMALYLAWTIPFALLVHLFGAWTMAANRHLNTLLEALPALVILVGVLLFSGPEPLIWATLLGFLLQVMLLSFTLGRHAEIEAPRYRFQSPFWQSMLAGLGLMLIGQFLISFVSLVDQFVAARLGTGELATLGYANRILSLVLGLGATAIGRAMLPVLSQAHVRGKRSLNQIARRWAGIMFGAGFFTMAVGILLAPQIVELLFQRGQFTIQDTQQVADVLRYGMLQVPFYLVSIVLVNALLSQGRQVPVILVSATGLVVKLLLSFVFVPILNLNGLLIATMGCYFATSLLAAYILTASRK